MRVIVVEGAYICTLNDDYIGMVATDLAKLGIGYQEVFATGIMYGYSGAFIVYADGSNAVKPAGYENPYMVCTAGNAVIY